MSATDTLLLITTSYPRWANGREAAGSFVADLAAELAAHVNVRVVAPGDERGVEQVSPRLKVYRYAAPRRRLVNLRIWNPRDAWRILCTLHAGQEAVKRATGDGLVHHMLALWALPPGWWARATGRKRAIPYSVWMLGSDVWALGRLPLVRSMLRAVMRDAQRRFADGMQLAEDSRRICDMPVGFLPTTRALETRDPTLPASRPPYRFVFIGRWHRNKGIDLLMDALARLGDDDWRCVSEVAIYGGGPLHPLVHEKVRPLLAKRRPIVIGGFIPKSEAEQAILRADYLVIPSRIESIPVIFSDAMKLSRPVIATPVGDLPALFSEAECGVLADQVNPEAFCRALQRALVSPPRTFAAGVHAQAARFDLARIATNILGEVFKHA